MPRHLPLRPGDPTQAGNYRIVGRIAEGGQGVVFLGQDGAGRHVAVKLLNATSLADPSARARMAKEVAAARRVAAFCTAQVLDAQLDGHIPFTVSEYIDGPSLAQQIAAEGPVTGPNLDRLAIGTITALVAIHQANVVHRDFKPGNVVLGPDGPRVIDFGIARDLSTEATASRQVLGTLSYIAPEQLAGLPVGPAADLFAWASTIIYAATGHNAFSAPDPAAMMHQILHGQANLDGVPGHLTATLTRCLAKDPNARPTAQEVLLSLLGQPVPSQATAVSAVTLAAATERVARGRAVPRQAQPMALVAPQSTPRSASRGRRALVVLAMLMATGVAVAAVATTGFRELPWGANATPATSATGTTTKTPAPGLSGGQQPSTSTTSAAQPTATGVAATTNTPLPTATPVTVPAAFSGTWSGLASQPTGLITSWSLTIVLEAGSSSGTIKLTTLECSGELTVTSIAPAATELRLHQRTTSDPKGHCADRADLTLIANESGTLDMHWKDFADSTNVATATLTRPS